MNRKKKAKKKGEMPTCPFSCQQYKGIREVGRSEQRSLSKRPHRGHGCNPAAPEQPGLGAREKYGEEQTRSCQSAAAEGQNLQRWQILPAVRCPQHNHGAAAKGCCVMAGDLWRAPVLAWQQVFHLPLRFLSTDTVFSSHSSSSGPGSK